MKHNFKKLIIWQDGMDICDRVYEYTASLPQSERYNLVSQLERSAVSIPSNIAEGSAKSTNKHFAEFLTTAYSSTFEPETQLLICQRRNFGKSDELEVLLMEVNKLQMKVHNFRITVLAGK